MRIILITTSGGKFLFDELTMDSTLGKLKQMIRIHEKKLFDIIFQGEVLNESDDKTLGSLDFDDEDENTIQLTSSKKGGNIL